MYILKLRRLIDDHTAFCTELRNILPKILREKQVKSDILRLSASMPTDQLVTVIDMYFGILCTYIRLLEYPPHTLAFYRQSILVLNGLGLTDKVRLLFRHASDSHGAKDYSTPFKRYLPQVFT